MMPPDYEETNSDGPLSMSEAIKAFTSTPTDEEIREDQADPEEALEGDDAETDLEADGDQDEDSETGDEDEQAEDDETEGDDDEQDDGGEVADTAKVRLEDGRVVSIADLKKGTLLHADYTRKTQDLAERTRSVEAQSTQTKQLSEQLVADRDFVTAVLQQFLPPMPDRSLMQTDPMAYMAQKEEHEAMRAQLEQIHGSQQRTQQQRQADTMQERQKKLAKEHAALLEVLPELKDEKRYKALFKDIADHGSHYALTADEIRGIDDSRYVRVLKDAIAYRKLQAAKPKAQAKVEGRPPVQKGGKRLNSGQQKAREQRVAMDNLNKTGSLKDGVRAFLASQKG